MIIDNPDAFKSWLTSILEPLCDADPAALAKYVYALVKKDKPLDELRAGMLDQLDVFLQQETKPFVDMLFKSLESQEYLKSADKLEPVAQPEPDQEADVENHAPNGTEERAPPPPAPLPSPPPLRQRVVVSRAPHKPVRAPPLEHTLVKVVPTELLLEEPVDQPPRRRDRREVLREKEDRRRRRSRSWERRARARRHNRDVDHPNDVRRRLSSRSPSPRGRYRNRSPPPADRHATRSRSKSPLRELERDRDRLRVTREMERDRMSRDRMSRDREHRDRLSRSKDRERSADRSRDRSRGSLSPLDARLEHPDVYKRRCRDFDEKGYCMRGDLCQWDHGTDPVVLEDAALSRALTVPALTEYNPLTPDIWCGQPAAFPYPPPALHRPHPPRELIPIPRIRHEVPPNAGALPPPPMPPRHAAPNNNNFDYSRLGGGRAAGAGYCSLKVVKVPRGMNDITHLNNHFGKFGKIVNIQVCFEGDPEAALITFSNPTEANVAFKSTEAVLNNRFIKVLWHYPDNKQSGAGKPQNKIVDRQTQSSHNKVFINRENVKATAENKLLEKAKENANGQEGKKEKPIEKSKQVIEMHKRAQALLETQLQQQVLLIQKLESGNVSGTQKAALMEAINSAQEGIEKLRKELVAYNKMLRQIQNKKPKTREEAQKEILDAELDMFTKQQEGQDVTDLMKKVGELRRLMSQQFPTHATTRRPHSRGGRFNSAMRFTRGAAAAKVFSVNQSVDHRPRALLISGFEADELEPLVTHFSQFGEVSSKQVNLSVPELVLQYKVRAHAEQAAAHGRNYNDRTLSITWVSNAKPMAVVNAQRNGDPPPPNSDAEPQQEISEAALLRFDEEEDEEAEDRSWRR